MQTGGTVDKDYPTGKDNDGYSFVITSPAFERILGYVKPTFSYEAQTVLQKDQRPNSSSKPQPNTSVDRHLFLYIV